MSSSKDKKYLIALLVTDGVMVTIAYLAFNYIRMHSGLFPAYEIEDQTLPMIVIGIYWLLVFWLLGMYKNWFAQSRLDEFLLTVRVITIGAVILFFLIFVDDARTNDPSSPRLKIIIYWALLVIGAGTGRMVLRSIRRRMLILGIGLRNTLLVGPYENAKALGDSLRTFRGLGYNVLGYATSQNEEQPSDPELPWHGSLDDLEDIIQNHEIEEIIVATESSDHELLLGILGKASAYKVRIKIRPDLYEIVSGQAKTNQIYGIPLIEVSPQLMPPWEAFIKRGMDIGVSFVVLILGLPLFIIIAIAQKLSSRGPVFYKQDRSGKDGKVFTMVKFRTMYTDAEKKTGPQWAVKNDPRVTPLGRFLRKSHLDELPQVFNVLQGDMSLVGPRPERPFFVEQFIKEIPLYRRRLNVRPGITGWAQVKHVYDSSIEDVKAKLRFDLYYIENMSIRMDLKIILNTAYRMIAGKGQA